MWWGTPSATTRPILAIVKRYYRKSHLSIIKYCVPRISVWFNGGSECVGAESLSEILDKAADIECCKNDWVQTYPGMAPTTTVVWSKGNKTRMESTVDGVNLIQLIDMDAGEMYSYYPQYNYATKTDFQVPPCATADISDFDPEIIGTETIDGKECLVIEWTQDGMLVKTWVWKEYGIPVRQEVTWSGDTSIFEWKNIEFVCAPDSMFELPAGVTIYNSP